MDIDAPSDVAAELSVPAYLFFPSGASDLAVFLNLPYYYPTVSSFREDYARALLPGHAADPRRGYVAVDPRQGERRDQGPALPVQAHGRGEGHAGQ